MAHPGVITVIVCVIEIGRSANVPFPLTVPVNVTVWVPTRQIQPDRIYARQGQRGTVIAAVVISGERIRVKNGPGVAMRRESLSPADTAARNDGEFRVAAER